MSFFRVLLALLISAAIAYGLYIAVDERRFDRAVEAVRTEIATRTGGAVEESDGAVEVEVPAQGETLTIERAEPQETANDTPVALAEDVTGTIEITRVGEADEAPATEETTAPADDAAAESTTFAERVEQDAATTETEETVGATDADVPTQDEADATEEPAEVEAAAQDDAEPTTGENDVPRIAAMPAPPEAVLPDDAQAPAALETDETQETLPAARLAGTTDTSTAALDAVNGGMNYAEARETMIEAGWSPRLPATRTGGPNAAENAMIEAGYGELEGCKGDERPICRFEFVDEGKRIAAVLTAGSGTDPSVIDAFLMTIRAE